MQVQVIEGFTRCLAKPADWDEEKYGRCVGLPILDHVDPATGQRSMISAWFPTDQELDNLVAGAALYLRVLGTIHPPVGMWAGDPNDIKPEFKQCRDLFAATKLSGLLREVFDIDTDKVGFQVVQLLVKTLRDADTEFAAQLRT